MSYHISIRLPHQDIDGTKQTHLFKCRCIGYIRQKAQVIDLKKETAAFG